MPMPSSLDPAGFLAFVRRQQCQRETAGPATGSASESNHQWVDIEFLASPMDRMRKAATAASMSPGSPSDALGRSSRETGGPLQPVLSPGTASCQNPMVLADADDGEEWFHAVTSEAHSATVDDLDAFTDHLAPPPSGPQIWRPPLLVSRSRRSSAIPTTSPFSLYESTIDPTSPSTPRQQLSSPVSVATMLPEIVRPPASPVRSMASTPLPQRHFQLRSPAVDTVVSFEEVCRRYVTSAIASTQQAGAPKPDEQGNDPGAVGAPRSRRATHTGAILVMSPSLVPAQSSESSQQLAELAPLPETLIPIAGALAGTLRMRASTMPPLRLAVLTSALKSSGVSPLASPASQGLGSADSDAVRARPVSSSDALEVSRRVSLQMPAAGTATSYNNGSPDKAPSVRDLAGGTFTNDGGLEGTRGGITSMGSAIQVTRAVAILSRSRRGGGGRAQSIESTSSGAGGASSSQLVSRRSIGSMASDSLNELHGEGDEGKEYSTIDDTAEDGEYSADRLTGGLGTVLGTSNTQSTGGTGDSSHHPNMGTGHTLSSGYDYFGTTDYLGDSPIVQVLDWPGHVELHPLHFPTESELYDSEGTLLELACFRNVDMANIHDPSLPSADVCWDIWRLMDDQKAPFSVVLFWLAKAGRTDEAMARINSELVSTASAALLYLGAQLRMLQGRHDEAIHDLEDVLYKDRTLPEAWALKGRMHQIYGPSRLCVNAFTHALKLIPGPTAWRVYFERGCVHEATKEPMYAFEDFKMVRMLQPECSEAIWRHAHYYLDKELYEDALSTIQVILDRKPGNAQALYLRGLALSQLTNWSRALDDFTAAIRIEPNAPAPYVHRGCLARICAPKKTIEDLSVALLLDENNVDALLHRGHVYYEMERFDLAHCDWNRVTELHASAHIHLNLGILSMHHLDDYVQAMHHLDAAVDLDPVLATTYLARAELCQRLHQESFMMSGSIIRRLRKRSGASSAEVNFLERQAVADLQVAATGCPGDMALHEVLGMSLFKVQQPEAAIAVFARMIQEHPEHITGYLARGSVYSQISQLKLAVRDFSHCLHLQPNCVDAYVNLGSATQRMGFMRRAWDHFTAALALDPSSAVALQGRASIHLARNDSFAALLDMTSAVNHMPDSARAMVNRGAVHQTMGDHVAALRDYKSAMALEPTMALAHFNAGNLYFGQQSWARAKACYDAAIALATHDFPALVNRGLTKIELGEFDDALEDLLLARQFAHSHFEIARVCYQLAGLSQKMGRIEDAELYLNSALQHMPQSIDAWIKRAEVRGQLGKMTGALQDYAHALTLDNKLESISPSIFARKSRA
ncbi:hypothetical protein BC828DRAFT_255322 [Blastocladiella britannica]|nr:hypothetical protein BC828DRAFT_255322 [Blastocladiella britannica]